MRTIVSLSRPSHPEHRPVVVAVVAAAAAVAVVVGRLERGPCRASSVVRSQALS